MKKLSKLFYNTCLYLYGMYGIDDQQTRTAGRRKHLTVEENEN